jgi:hypothetical protein
LYHGQREVSPMCENTDSIDAWRRSIFQPPGPTSGVSAVLGQLPDGASDEAVIEALDRLS